MHAVAELQELKEMPFTLVVCVAVAIGAESCCGVGLRSSTLGGRGRAMPRHEVDKYEYDAAWWRLARYASDHAAIEEEKQKNIYGMGAASEKPEEGKGADVGQGEELC